MVAITPIQPSEISCSDLGIMAFYSMQLHVVVMEAWRQFAESLHEMKEKSDHEYRTRQEKKRVEEGARTEAENRDNEFFEEVIQIEMAERQARAFHYFEENWGGNLYC